MRRPRLNPAADRSSDGESVRARVLDEVPCGSWRKSTRVFRDAGSKTVGDRVAVGVPTPGLYLSGSKWGIHVEPRCRRPTGGSNWRKISYAPTDTS
jgi:hypothetical protein